MGAPMEKDDDESSTSAVFFADDDDDDESSKDSSNEKHPEPNHYALRGGHANNSQHDEVLTLGSHNTITSGSAHHYSHHYIPLSSLGSSQEYVHAAPKGLQNVGNTCYANAALQCLLSTALTNVLLDPTTVEIFRRYSSNPRLLEKGSGSVDSGDDSDVSPVPTPPRTKRRPETSTPLPPPRPDAQTPTMRGSSQAQPRNSSTSSSRKQSPSPVRKPSSPPPPIAAPAALPPTAPARSAERQKRRERRRKEREDRKMQENCRWLTRELKAITLEYHDDIPRKSGPAWINPAEWLSARCRYSVVDPSSITKHPDRLSKCLRPFQQEDAHEFLRALLSTLVMNGQNKQLSSLFDGLLESAVTCQCCRRPSLTRDRYMDLSLDILAPHIKTLTDALFEFTKIETLSGDNKVYCGRCNTKCVATKGLRLATAPSILVCHLKRFAFDAYGRLVRLRKRVQFDLRLEIGGFMSHVNKARPPPYALVAVLVHQGQSCDSGHYLAYVKNNGDWFRCNDAEVTKVDVATVLQQQAYILMYEVEHMREKHGFGPPTRQQFPSSGASWREDGTIATSDTKRRDYHQAQYPHNHPFSFVTMLCGLDDAVLNDVCCGVSYFASDNQENKTKKTKSISSNRSRTSRTDDLSTLGESTVDSSETSKIHLRRSTSSGNLNMKALRAHQHASERDLYSRPGSSSAPRSRRLHSFNSSDTGNEEDLRIVSDYKAATAVARKWTCDRQSRRPPAQKGELPPRHQPQQHDRPRRSLSITGVV